MSYDISLYDLRYFEVLSQELHYGRASEKLHITQPALSKQIKKLEERLGLTLFDRHNRKVELTEAGKFLQSQASNLLDNWKKDIGHAKQLQKGIAGSLRIGYVGSAIQFLTHQLLTTIRDRFPDIQFELQEMGNFRQIQWLEEQQLDMGFIRTEGEIPGLESLVVQRDHFCLVTPKGFLKSNQSITPDFLNSLKEEEFILFDSTYSPTYYERVMQIFNLAGFGPRISHKTVHAHTIYNLVENNFGLAIVPDSLRFGFSFEIDFIPLDQFPQRASLRLAWNKKNKNRILGQSLEFLKTSQALDDFPNVNFT